MPIIFVHGVASRMEGGHDRVWTTIEENLREHIAPQISKDSKSVLIEEAYWGNFGVPTAEHSLPDDERIKKLYKAKKSWILRRIIAGDIQKDFLPEALKRLVDVSGHFITRLIDPARKPLNKQVTLFLGDVFTYLAMRGTPEKPGNITKQLLKILKKAHDEKTKRGNEPLVVISHSMGGQLVYDAVTYYLPEMSKIPEYESYKDIRIDFWCATASQVGLFKEMKLFQTDITNPSQSAEKAPFPDKHLNLWWNLWDANDYLSFTTDSFFDEVIDDLYDSGRSFFKAHTSHFDQPDFYKELALMLQEAEWANWSRGKFVKNLKS